MPRPSSRCSAVPACRCTVTESNSESPWHWQVRTFMTRMCVRVTEFAAGDSDSEARPGASEPDGVSLGNAPPADARARRHGGRPPPVIRVCPASDADLPTGVLQGRRGQAAAAASRLSHSQVDSCARESWQV